VRQQLKDSYSETGRPSIDPELLLRILLIGYLYGITSERRFVEELRMHLAWRWFNFDQEIPHHSTFSKNRHGRFQESKLFEQMFEQIVRQCVEVGLVEGKHLADRNITPYMRTRDSIHRKKSPYFGPERFTYEPEHNRYLCPAGQPLNYGGRVYRNRAFNYIGTRKRCGACALRPQCTSAAFRSLNIHQNESARQRARELAKTPASPKRNVRERRSRPCSPN
jgi:hypothetical protein